MRAVYRDERISRDRPQRNEPSFGERKERSRRVRVACADLKARSERLLEVDPRSGGFKRNADNPRLRPARDRIGDSVPPLKPENLSLVGKALASRWLSSELNSCSKPCSVETRV